MARPIDDMIEKLCPSKNKNNRNLLSPYYEKERRYLDTMLRTTVLGNEKGTKTSTSVIVYGAPGCGKTTFIEGTIRQLEQDTAGFSVGCKIVRLNGHTCTPWKKAINEMCHQLSIKTLLSDEGQGRSEEGDLDEYLEQAFVLLKANMSKYDKSVIFILDNVELFADANQIMLYNLFDLASINSSVPVCIIGLTCSVEILEMFEKRVKSRFSHRQINLAGHFDTFDKYLSCALQLLQHSKDGQWNLDVLMLCESSKVKNIFQTMYDNNKSLADLINYLYTVLLVADRSLKVADFLTAFTHMFPVSSKVQMALDLSANDLLPLIAIFKYMANSKQKAMQPKMLYSIVEKAALRFSITQEGFMQSIRKIRSLDMIEAVESTISTADNYVSSDTYFKTNFSHREFLEIWKTYPNLPTDFQELL